MEMNIFLLRQDKLSERIRELKETLELLHDTQLQTEARLHENSNERTALDDIISRMEDDISQYRADIRLSSEEAHKTETARERAEARGEALKAEEERLTAQVAAADSRLEVLRRLAEEGEGSGSLMQEELTAAAEALTAAEEEAAAAEQAAEEAEERLNDHKADILTAVNRLSDVRNSRTQKETMCAQMENYLEQLRSNESERVSRQAELRQQYDAALELQREADETLTACRGEARRLEAEARSLGDEMNTQNDRRQKLNLDMQSARSRLHVLSEMARDMEGYANAVRRALQAGHNDPDVCGVVAQLIEVPKELETAVDSVLGGALQNIITGTDVTAKRLIEYLKRTDGGRATFLPLNTVRPYSLNNEERRVLSMPGCLGVASELIGYDQKYRPVMENLLGRTVIASDLNAALPIMRAGRYSFRLVTLDGQVMHSGGSMTGGSMKGKTSNFLSREREIKELTARLQEDEKLFNHLTEEAVRLQDKQREARRLSAEAAEAMHQQEIAVAREQEHVFNTSAELESAEQQLNKTRAAITQLVDSLEELRADLKSLTEGTESAAVDREALEQKTEQLQDELRAAREKADLLRGGLERRRLELADLQHKLDTLRRDKERREQEENDLRQERAEAENKLTEQRKMLEDGTELLRQLTEAAAEQNAALRQLEEDTAALEKTRSEKQAQQRELVAESERLHEKYNADGEQLHRTELQSARAENELNTLTEHMWNTYEATLAIAEEYRLPADAFSLTAGEKEAAGLQREIRALGPINTRAVEEYAQTKERFDDMTRQQEDMTKAEADLRSLIKRLMGQMEKQFVVEFDRLNGYFKETFVRLFGGGQAELKLEDPNEPLTCGIEVVAQPPGKKLQLLSLLSGGERALTAIAILFAMLKVRPTPFCILDEIEAALDEANIGYFADYLVEFAKGTQFVVVTHRKGTMERCDSLYGVAMQEKGVSRMVSVNLENYQ
ncbi:MAG: chromosome segregation protein SMC [Clostridia bacterium]|nr:chromosome segregation protein SMC [Clostridia bacterium]